MTVRIHDAAFTAEAAAPRDPSKYQWFQITRGKVHLDSASKKFDVELTKGEKFGLRVTKTATYLVDEDDLTVQFKLSPDDVAAVLKNAKGFSGKVSGKIVSPGNPNQLAEGTPLNVIQKRKLKEQYDNLSANLRQHLLRNLKADIEGNKRLFSETDLRKTLRSLNKAALQLKANGSLPKPNSLIGHYGIGQQSTTAVIKVPAPDMEKLDSYGKELRKKAIQQAKKVLSHLSKKIQESGRESFPRGTQYTAGDARRSLRVLQVNGIKVPKTYQPIINVVSVKTRSSKAPISKAASPQNSSKSHPGLEIKQGSVPTQDKKGEAAKRITDKNVIAHIKKLGIELHKDNLGYYALGVKKNVYTTVVDTLLRAGWKGEELLTEIWDTAGRPYRGTEWSLMLPGGNRYVRVVTTGRLKGRVTVETNKRTPKMNFNK